ncbi:TonB-dependent receptor [Nostoc sp.]|uniref:TonB-dependent receptor n=1 Tax=Nostoc sp. TaxID=1180 RepID=UPI002FF6D45B
MKLKQLIPSFLLSCTIVALLTTPALSEEISSTEVPQSTASTKTGASSTQQTRLVTKAQHIKPITEIRRLSQIKRPSSQQLVQSPAQETAPTSEVVQVTEVKANPTDKGVEVILQTTKGQQLQLVNRSNGNNFIVDIPNAQLHLPSGEAFTFHSDKPITGVTQITVTNFDANTIRVSVTGETGVPIVELYDSANEGIIFSVASTAPRAQQTQPQTQQPQTIQPPSQTQPTQPSASGDEPIELVVTGDLDGYNAPNATTATRTDTPLRDIPQSIQVIPQQIIKDQQAIRLTDALRNVSGVQAGSSFGGTRDSFVIRGFGQGVLFRDGFRDSVNRTTIRETANLERIEVLKGPASVLFGTIEPGGIINLVTKQPLSEPFYYTELQVGNFGLVRPSIDFSGPLNSDRTLLYRLNAVYESGGNFRDFDQGVDRFFVSPVLTWKISDRTDLTFEFSYLDDTRPFDITGIPPIGRKIADIPYNRNLGEPDNFAFRNELSASYRLEHRFSENWTLRNAFRFSSSDQRFIGARYDTLDETTGNLSRSWSDNSGTNQSYAFQTNLIGKFATGSVKHTLLFGVDLNRDINDLDNYFGDGAPSINIFNPVYRVAPIPRRENLSSNVTFNQRLDILGIYLQDQIALADNLKLLVGGRFDIVDQESRFTSNAGANTNTQQQDNAFTPRVGIVYQPVPPLSLYASYSQSFAPNSATTVSGSLLEPERGTQYEVGIRGEFLNGRLSTNLAAYHLTKSNIATTDPNNTDYSIPVGEQTSQGIELDVVGEILTGWNIIANYAYTDALVTKDNSPIQGNRLNGAPYNAASLWTTYQIQRGNLQGLGFGLGLFYVGEREGDLENTYELSSYLRTDANIFYKKNNWRAGINFKNIFNVDYIEGTFSRDQVTPGAPFTVLGTFSIEF